MYGSVKLFETSAAVLAAAADGGGCKGVHGGGGGGGRRLQMQPQPQWPKRLNLERNDRHSRICAAGRSSASQSESQSQCDDDHTPRVIVQTELCCHFEQKKLSNCF